MGIDAWIDRVGAVAHVERVTVRWCFRYELRGDVAACTRPRIHDDLLPPRLRELLADDARHQIAAAARRRADHDAYRFRGIARLSVRARTKQAEAKDCGCGVPASSRERLCGHADLGNPYSASGFCTRMRFLIFS